jgi:hypothetical protein
MKKLLTAFAAATSITLAAILPAPATTFTLRTIYVGSGVYDDGSGASGVGVATSVHCTNLSGKLATIRVSFYYGHGGLAGTDIANVANKLTRTVSTHSVGYFTNVGVNTGTLSQGVLNVTSTESAVFCTAMIVDAAGPIPTGVPLHLVRFNPHPGSVE